MVRTLSSGLLLACLAGMNTPVLGERLSDALSPRQQVDIDLVWKDQTNLETLGDKAYNTVIARARNVDTRLDTSAYLGSRARIYLELPIQVRGLANPGSLELSWTTNGLFSPGRVTPGTRQLIFEGMITDPVMRDIFDFTFEVDARFLTQTLRLEPVYEIEIVKP
jgi:hypothetical protein